jgi:hypothetical protein
MLSRHASSWPLLLAALGAVAACNEATSVPDLPPQRDLFPARDLPPTPGDRPLLPADQRAKDGPSSRDRAPDSTVCAGSLASCAPCSSSQLCTASGNGTCVEAVKLSGTFQDKATLQALAIAFASCWERHPNKHVLCATFNGCALVDPIAESNLSSWVCASAGVTDFPSTALHDAAKSLFACWTGHVYRPWWVTPSLQPGIKGQVCLSYKYYGPIGLDRLEVNACQAQP